MEDLRPCGEPADVVLRVPPLGAARWFFCLYFGSAALSVGASLPQLVADAVSEPHALHWLVLVLQLFGSLWSIWGTWACWSRQPLYNKYCRVILAFYTMFAGTSFHLILITKRMDPTAHKDDELPAHATALIGPGILALFGAPGWAILAYAVAAIPMEIFFDLLQLKQAAWHQCPVEEPAAWGIRPVLIREACLVAWLLAAACFACVPMRAAPVKQLAGADGAQKHATGPHTLTVAAAKVAVDDTCGLAMELLHLPRPSFRQRPLFRAAVEVLAVCQAAEAAIVQLSVHAAPFLGTLAMYTVLVCTTLQFLLLMHVTLTSGSGLRTVWSVTSAQLMVATCTNFLAGRAQATAIQAALLRVLHDLVPDFIAQRLVADEVAAESRSTPRVNQAPPVSPSVSPSFSSPPSASASAPLSRHPSASQASFSRLLARSPFSGLMQATGSQSGNVCQNEGEVTSKLTVAGSSIATALSLEQQQQQLNGGPRSTDFQATPDTPRAPRIRSQVSQAGRRMSSSMGGAALQPFGALSTTSFHPSVTLLFSDIVGYSRICEELEPVEVMAMLDDLYRRFDDICLSTGKAWKIDTIGDAYVVAANLLQEDPDHAATMVKFAVAMHRAAAEVQEPRGGAGETLRIRVGIHTGPLTSGVVGKIRKKFCVLGSTVNCASRMESNGVPGRVQISASTHALLSSDPRFQWECRGEIAIKNMGTVVAYLLVE